MFERWVGLHAWGLVSGATAGHSACSCPLCLVDVLTPERMLDCLCPASVPCAAQRSSCCSSVRRLFRAPKPWRFGSLYLPDGSKNLDNPEFSLEPGTKVRCWAKVRCQAVQRLGRTRQLVVSRDSCGSSKEGSMQQGAHSGGWTEACLGGVSSLQLGVRQPCTFNAHCRRRWPAPSWRCCKLCALRMGAFWCWRWGWGASEWRR